SAKRWNLEEKLLETRSLGRAERSAELRLGCSALRHPSARSRGCVCRRGHTEEPASLDGLPRRKSAARETASVSPLACGQILEETDLHRSPPTPEKANSA